VFLQLQRGAASVGIPLVQSVLSNVYIPPMLFCNCPRNLVLELAPGLCPSNCPVPIVYGTAS